MSEAGDRKQPGLKWLHRLLGLIGRRILLMEDADARRRAITTVLFGMSMAFWATVFAPIYAALGSTRGAIIIIAGGTSCLSGVLMVTLRGWIQLAGNFIAAVVLATLLSLSVYTGGFQSPAIIWLPSVPMITILLCGWSTSRFWLLITLLSACGVFLLSRQGVLPASEFQGANAEAAYILCLLGIITCTTLLCFIFDFNSRVLQQQLEVARLDAEQGSRAKSEFVALMSHEIRTPMNGIIGMLELLGNTEITAWQGECISLAKQSADSLLRLLNDILDFSKIEAGKMELECISFHLRDVVGDTLQPLEFQAEKKGLELVLHIPPEIPDKLVGDPWRLRQILINLVGNALKFTERGEIVVRVSKESLSETQVSLHFAVTDSGVGIPSDKRHRIWEAFGQADSSTTRKFGGTGLGLNISQRLIEMMGGQLSLSSQEGVGSTFEFTIRLARSTDETDLPVVAPASLSNVPILVVEDNAASRSNLLDMLSDFRMRATGVDSARSALQALEERSLSGDSFAVVLIDSMMPETDGWTLAEQIRNDARYDTMALILLCSSTSSVRRESSSLAGSVSQLRKPVRPAELLESLLHVLIQKDSEASLTRNRSASQTQRPLKILLAEDGLINQKVAVGLLAALGHHVTVAENGVAAVRAFEQDSFDLILMDVEMPQMDGLKATAIIREREEVSRHRTPIVAMTAHALKGDRERFLAADMDDYLSKPVDPWHLRQVIGRLTRASDLSTDTEKGNS